MNLTAVLVTGLFAGGVSCAAVQGGLLTGLISRQRTAQTQPTRSRGRTKKAPSQPNAPTRSVGSRLGDDLTPVGAFLAGKLISHTALGALLGAVGGAAQLSLGVRTWLQIIAGVLIISLGMAQLGVPGFRRVVIEPPASWTRLVRHRARSQSAFAPALLGLATVLIPCGATLSVEALALTSGSALAGAATMAVFVTGTSPLFTLLGYAARKAATAWRSRLAITTGVAVVLLGLYTFNGGLELAGSPVAASRIVRAATGSTPSGPATGGPAPAKAAPGAAPSAPSVRPPQATASSHQGRQIVKITALEESYRPSIIQAKAGTPTTLVIKTEGVQGCVRGFVLPSLNKEKILPYKGETRIDLGVLRPGTVPFSCAMGMYTGAITVV